ncbi:MAG: response regulator, partial [Planctomycetes bacterium]|nr:response regulator [Planctomycetota bacterium]
MSKEYILIVEDDRNIRELLEYALRKEGYRILGAGSSEDALKAVRADPPDLILLDL